MPDNGRFPEREIEHSLRDLGARIEYPPTPDVAHTVIRKLEEERSPETRRTLRWPPFFAPRWTAVAAALILISVVALSPTLRTTLSGLFVPQSGSEAGGSAAKPGSGGSEDRHKQGAEVAPQDAGAPAASEQEAACPSPSIEAQPARAAAGAKFRLRGHDFSGCDGVKIFFRQDGKTWKLATLEARGQAFDIGVRVPESAKPGPASVRTIARAGEPVKTRFVVLR